MRANDAASAALLTFAFAAASCASGGSGDLVGDASSTGSGGAGATSSASGAGGDAPTTSSASTASGAGGDGGAGPASSSATSSGGMGTSSSNSSGAGGMDPGDAITFMLVRVGAGSAALTPAATPVFIEHRRLDGSLVTGSENPIPMPIAASGANRPFTLSGAASSEGSLSRSADGRYVTLAGYAAAPGTDAVSSSASADVNRVVARIDASGAVDTTTRFAAAFSGNSARGATSADGTAFWVTGNGSGGATAGVQHVLLGATDGTQVLATPSNTRVTNIVGGQLYGSSGSSTFVNVFSIGAGLPTSAGQTATPLPGMPTSSASPYSFVLLDRNPAIAGLDTLYVADDRTTAAGGGIQKWTYNGATWSLATTFDLGTGARGLAGAVTGTSVSLIATTTETTGNHVVLVDDDGSSSPATSVITTAPTNTVFRGVALAPE